MFDVKSSGGESEAELFGTVAGQLPWVQPASPPATRAARLHGWCWQRWRQVTQQFDDSIYQCRRMMNHFLFRFRRGW